ncbi:hypothetical protein K3495_g12132 [Podosphaera aphanis]|nr:hypothetical protein K3495_g12132 [Podosphaera aphanis]
MEQELLVPLKTTLELDSCEKIINVWIVGVEDKSASKTLSLIRSLIPGDGILAFQHLKRFARLGDVPESVRNAFSEANIATHLKHGTTPYQMNDSIMNISSESVRDYTPLTMKEKLLLLVICPVDALSHDTIKTALSAIDETLTPTIIATSVPLLAPTSAAQASDWTKTHWPTVYKKNNPFGPHPSIVSRAQTEIEKDARQWIALAREVAAESSGCEKERNRGEAIGVVIVERKQGVGKAIAVAGDARWLGWGNKKIGGGNPTAHAVMRAIAMIATSVRVRHLEKKAQKKLQELPNHTSPLKSLEENTTIVEDSATVETRPPEPREAHSSPTRPKARGARATGTATPGSIFHGEPLSPQEAFYLDPAGNHSGYLCHNLEIYCTHEPCVACSMALVHSRFGRVVFAQQMPRSGGLTADGVLGHGLFWRKELNWNMLAWQLRAPVADDADDEDCDVEA